jgi:hypothetical protein
MTKKVPEYKDHLVGVDIVTIPAGEGYRTCEEIMQERQKANYLLPFRPLWSDVILRP